MCEREIKSRYSPAKTSAGMPTINTQRNGRQLAAHRAHLLRQGPQGLLNSGLCASNGSMAWSRIDALQQESPHLCQLPTRAGGVTALKTTERAPKLYTSRASVAASGSASSRWTHARTGGGKKCRCSGARAIALPLPRGGHGRLIHPGDDGKLRLTDLGFGKLQFAGLVGCCLQQVDKGRCQAFIASPRVGKAGFGSRKNRRKTVGKAKVFMSARPLSQEPSHPPLGRKKAAWRSFLQGFPFVAQALQTEYKAPATRAAVLALAPADKSVPPEAGPD